MKAPAGLLLAAILLAAMLWTARYGGGARPAAAEASAACEQRRFDGSIFIACRYDRRKHALALFLDEGGTPLRTLARIETHLGPRAGRLLFAMNAGMYDDRGMPIGLYVERGRERHAVVLRSGPGNFGMKPNGVMAVGADGKLAVMTSEDWARSDRKALWPPSPGRCSSSAAGSIPRSSRTEARSMSATRSALPKAATAGS
jgi:uncharacterized protein YigE (DUF2233 family)